MAYIRKIVTQDEKLVGIARLHWIYVLRGLGWFLALSVFGWVVDALMARGLYMVAQATGADAMAVTLMSLSHNIMLFMMGAGFLLFCLFVLKVLVTEIGLTTRRVIHKEGLLFVKVKQIDLEEIRGENMDSGTFGRILGYAYIMLDCRFIGDIRLPAIESPERFMRALHQTRSIPLDTLSMVIGKGNAVPVGVVDTSDTGPDTPQPQPPQPTPEILPGQEPAQPEVQPGNVPPGPEIPAKPVPHNPPAPPGPPPQPQTPPVQPPPVAPPPINPQPPLQPPEGAQLQQIVTPIVAQSVSLPPEAVAQVVQQVLPQMAQQVVREMENRGLVANDTHKEHEADTDIDTDLLASFDEARLDKDGKAHDLRNKMEHAIH